MKKSSGSFLKAMLEFKSLGIHDVLSARMRFQYS